MSRDAFIASLRVASQLLGRPNVSSDLGVTSDAHIVATLVAADLWLTPKSVEGFDPADFGDHPRSDVHHLIDEVTAFKSIAMDVPSNKPATKSQSKQARKHLENAIHLVGRWLLRDWQEALRGLIGTAKGAADSRNWFTEVDEKEISESVLGKYRAPRLRIRSADREAVLDPVALFGSGGQGVVDLLTLPTYETAYVFTWKSGVWKIVSARGALNARNFTPESFINTVNRLPTC